MQIQLINKFTTKENRYRVVTTKKNMLRKSSKHGQKSLAVP